MDVDYVDEIRGKTRPDSLGRLSKIHFFNEKIYLLKLEDFLR